MKKKRKKFLSGIKRLPTESYAVILIVLILLYVVLSFLYWLVEIGPGGSKSFLDILLQ